MSQLPSVCPDCGVVFERMSNAARCPDCEQPRRQESQASSNYLHKSSPESRGYDWRWRQLSKRARALSPQCEDCGSVDDLTTDHSVTAWERRAQGKSIRLRDVAVVCRRCNTERGAARGPGASAHLQWERDLSVLAHELDGEDNDGHG